MEDKLYDVLDDLNIRDTQILLDKDINLSIDSLTRKRIEKSILKKTGFNSKDTKYKDKSNNIFKGILMKRKIALALSIGVILSLGGGGFAYAKTPVAYVSMDINPSIELGVNVFDKVVSVEAYNEDGKKILEGTDLVNYDVENAVSVVIKNAISDGYIEEDGSSAIELTTATDKEKVAVELDESLKEAMNETLNDNNVEAEVITEKVALVRRNEARKLGITPGKLSLIEKLQELDPTISVEDYKSSSVKDIQNKTKELRKDNKSEQTTIDDDINIDAATKEENEEPTTIEKEKYNNSSKNKGNTKAEENSNSNEDKNNTATMIKKQNNGNNANSQGINNSSKEEKTNNSDSESKSNNGNSNGNAEAQNKGKSKNN